MDIATSVKSVRKQLKHDAFGKYQNDYFGGTLVLYGHIRILFNSLTKFYSHKYCIKPLSEEFNQYKKMQQCELAREIAPLCLVLDRFSNAL